MKKTKLSFFNDKNYKKIISDYSNGYAKIIQFKEFETTQERLKSEVNELVKKTKSALNKYSINRRKELESWNNEIKRTYNGRKREYTDPNQEILRRQDFDLELSLMNSVQVRKTLQDKARNFSIYELNKIATTFKDDTIITSHVRTLKEELEQPYKQDLNYIENQNAINELSLLSSDFIYLPDGGRRGFKTISLLDFQGTKLKSVASLTKELESLNHTLDLFELKPNIKTYKQELKNGKIEEQATKEMTVKIFRNSKTFDIAERFEFLKSRYDDKTLFNVNEDNYSAVNHLSFLEKQLEKDLETNSDFKDEYNAMMKTAENQQE